MQKMRVLLVVLLVAWNACLPSFADDKPDPTDLVRQAYALWRGTSSYAEVAMTVHRPEWERSMSLVAWTRGQRDSLVRFTAPPKDAGNATLMLGPATWVFDPKISQIIQVPGGMMAQSWMGSDFSYDDLAKSDSVLKDYTHRLVGTTEVDGHRVFVIEAIPKPDAPVVWGKQVIKVRDDHILLQEVFYDQDMHPVRELDATRIGKLDGRIYPVEMTMRPLDEQGRWTRIVYAAGYFDLSLPDYLFTSANLRNPRPWKAP